MAQLPGKKRGCPLKHKNGLKGANKVICISNATFSLWRNIREELGLLNDDGLAIRGFLYISYVHTFSGSLLYYITEISFARFIFNLPHGMPLGRFPSTGFVECLT